MFVAPSGSPGPQTESIDQTTPHAVIWTHVERPGDPADPEIVQLKARFGLSDGLVAAALRRERYPFHVADGDVSLASLYAGPPAEDGTTSPSLALLMSSDFLVTINHGGARAVARLFRECQDDPALRRDVLGHGPAGVLVGIVERIASQYYQAASGLSRRVVQVEQGFDAQPDAQSDSQPDAEWAREVLALRREAAGLARSLDASRPAIASLAGANAWSDFPTLDWQRALGRLDSSSLLVEQCRTTLAALVDADVARSARRSAGAQRLATALLAIILPSGLFGVLILAGGASALFPFEWLLGGAVFYALVGLYFFRRAGWL